MKTSTENARALRKNLTPHERRLWHLLRDRRLGNHKFRRQLPVGCYIVDFACWRARLVVELDGGQHSERAAYDRERTAWLTRHGWRVLRFWNNELENMEGVLMVILAALEEPPSP